MPSCCSAMLAHSADWFSSLSRKRQLKRARRKPGDSLPADQAHRAAHDAALLFCRWALAERVGKHEAADEQGLTRQDNLLQDLFAVLAVQPSPLAGAEVSDQHRQRPHVQLAMLAAHLFVVRKVDVRVGVLVLTRAADHGVPFQTVRDVSCPFLAHNHFFGAATLHERLELRALLERCEMLLALGVHDLLDLAKHVLSGKIERLHLSRDRGLQFFRDELAATHKLLEDLVRLLLLPLRHNVLLVLFDCLHALDHLGERWVFTGQELHEIPHAHWVLQNVLEDNGRLVILDLSSERVVIHVVDTELGRTLFHRDALLRGADVAHPLLGVDFVARLEDDSPQRCLNLEDLGLGGDGRRRRAYRGKPHVEAPLPRHFVLILLVLLVVIIVIVVGRLVLLARLVVIDGVLDHDEVKLLPGVLVHSLFEHLHLPLLGNVVRAARVVIHVADEAGILQIFHESVVSVLLVECLRHHQRLDLLRRLLLLRQELVGLRLAHRLVKCSEPLLQHLLGGQAENLHLLRVV
mmetsp:Transcript_85764/g.171301  ORF Transcript_85764/g.171301 Transcript_85764/m.171301 type:complete len:520 (-) Transcript_85764:436-1995(-)